MNATIRRFGYPATLVAEYENWIVLLRPEQPTLGSLILAAKSDAVAFAALPPEAFSELAEVTAQLERALAEAVAYEKINYLMLMMVDPHVHFHVIPRYAGMRTAKDLKLDDLSISDKGWPKAPVLGEAVALGSEQIAALTTMLRTIWPK